MVLTENRQTKKIAIFGAGIGGLSAAHELIERNYLGKKHFQIDVYEGGPGCKALSQTLQGTGREARADLPGEHGFRFFPAFYWHVIDTMSRIPDGTAGSRRYVADHLLGCDQFSLASKTTGRLTVPRQIGSTLGDYFDVVGTIRDFFGRLRLNPVECGRFALRMLEYMCTCDKRRFATHESTSFWDWVEANKYSPQFQTYINSPRFMVAMDASRGSARTLGNQCVQLLLDFRRRRGTTDRVLDGPTTSTWIDPWLKYLESQGVVFHRGKKLTGFQLSGGKVAGARVEGETNLVTADYYISAIPAEQLEKIIDDPLAAADEQLAYFREDSKRMLGDMTGAQFYLRNDVPVCSGHVAYPDAEWALSSISPVQFWDRGLPREASFTHRYGDGSIGGFISVDVSDWDTPSRRTGKTARDCKTKQEMIDEIWHQLKEGLNTDGPVLEDKNLVHVHLDQNVSFDERGAHNSTPLLVHPPRSWRSRPEAITGLGNLFLATDVVRTYTDLATMEGANEAARRAVNGILDDMNIGPRCEVRELKEEAGYLIAKAKRIDERRLLKSERPESLVADREYSIDEALQKQDELFARLREQAE